MKPILMTRAVFILLTTAIAAAVAQEGKLRSVNDPPKSVAEEAADRGWPRKFETPGHVVYVHQPQVDEWANFDRIRFRAAIAVLTEATRAMDFGIIVVSASTDVAFEERLVVLNDRKIESLEFPDASSEDAARLKQVVTDATPPQKPQTISLDRIIAELNVNDLPVRKVAVNLSPPKIYYSDKPAVMVNFIGKPRFKPIPGSDLQFAVNTNWDVFLDQNSSNYYLLNEESWLTTSDLQKGPWKPTISLPPGLWALPDDENWADVRAAVPGKPANQVTSVFVSFEPAELIVVNGEAKLEPIPGTGLMLVTNSESRLFYQPSTRQYYLLAAGRWFSAPDPTGPWAAASASLPEDFKKIPEDNDFDDVLASVPGTKQAEEAIILASIPNKATVNKSEVTVDVTYSGTPDFRPIETTPIKYAVNSPFSVFLVEGKYYCCHNAVWFEAPTPTGPWVVCTSVPKVIYTIPTTSPQHNVTYVYVYDSTPTTVVTGYTAGYSGQTVAATGAVMFGLGVLLGAAIADDDNFYWSYHYRSCYYSYGCGARWSWSGGGYVSAGRVYGPYGGAGGYAAYNPANGRWSRGAYAYGPSGAAGYRAAYNPSTGLAGYRAGATTPYGSWSRGAVTNGDEWIRGGRATNARGGSAAAIGTSEGGAIGRAEGRYGNGVTVGRTQDGDIYAGRDGNVYKRSDDGWEQQRSSNRSSANSASPKTYPRASPEQSRYLQERSTSRQRGESNYSRAGGSASRSRGGGGGRR